MTALTTAVRPGATLAAPSLTTTALTARRPPAPLATARTCTAVLATLAGTPALALPLALPLTRATASTALAPAGPGGADLVVQAKRE